MAMTLPLVVGLWRVGAVPCAARVWLQEEENALVRAYSFAVRWVNAWSC